MGPALWTGDQGQRLFTRGEVPMVMLTRWLEVVFMSPFFYNVTGGVEKPPPVYILLIGPCGLIFRALLLFCSKTRYFESLGRHIWFLNKPACWCLYLFLYEQ